MGKFLEGFDYLGSWNKESYDMRMKLLTHWVLLFVYNHGNHNYEPTILSYNHSNNNQTQKRFYKGYGFEKFTCRISLLIPMIIEKTTFPSRQTQLTQALK